MTQIISRSKTPQIPYPETTNNTNHSVISAIKDRVFFEIKKSIQKVKGMEIVGLDSMLTLSDMCISRAEYVSTSNRESIRKSTIFKNTTVEEFKTIDSLIKSAPLHNELTFIQIFSIKILNEIDKHKEILPREIKEDFLDLIDNLSTIYMECLYLAHPSATPPYRPLPSPTYFSSRSGDILNLYTAFFSNKHISSLDKNPELITLKSHLNILIKLLNVVDYKFSLYSIECASYSECTTPVLSAYEFIPVCNLTIEHIANFIRKRPKCKISSERTLSNLRDQFCELVSLLEKTPLSEEEKEISTKNNKNIRNLCLTILKQTSIYSKLVDEKLLSQKITPKEFAEYQNQIKKINFVVYKILSTLPEIDSVNINAISARTLLLSSIISFSQIEKSEPFTATEKKDRKKLAKIAQIIDSLSSVTILKKHCRFDYITYEVAKSLLPIYRPVDIKYSFEQICLTIDSAEPPINPLDDPQERENPLISRNITRDDHYPFNPIYFSFNETLDFQKFSADIKEIHHEISTRIASVSPESLTNELEISIRKAIYARCQKHILQCILYADMNLILNQEETTFENLFPESLLDILLFKLPQLDKTSFHSNSKISIHEEATSSSDCIAAVHEDLEPKDELLTTDVHDESQAAEQPCQTPSQSSMEPITKREKILATQGDAACTSRDETDADELPSVSSSDLVEIIRKMKKTRKIISLLTSLGFKKEAGKGSHLHLRSPEGKLIVIPLHEELKLGTKLSIANSLAD